MRASLALPFLLLTAVLAGCAGSSGNSGKDIAITGSGSTYTFHARAAADNYTWDLGDRSPAAYGRDVTHTYGFANGNLTVKLTTRSGASSADATADLTLGNGQNAPPTFILDAPTNWTSVDTPFSLSAAQSTDPDHDPLLYSWSCLRERDIMRIAPHPHPPPPGGPGVRFDTLPAGAVTARLATKPLPAPDHTYTGDFCSALGLGSAFSHDATISGTFAKQGFYTLTLLATDGKLPPTAGRWQLYVSAPGDRPDPIQRHELKDTFQGGHSGEAQSTYDELHAAPGGSQLPNETFDGEQVSFTLPLAADPTYVNFTFDTSNAANAAHWTILRGDQERQTGTGNLVIPSAHRLEAGPYTLRVQLDQGANVAFHVTFEAHLVMDPTAIY